MLEEVAFATLLEASSELTVSEPESEILTAVPAAPDSVTPGGTVEVVGDEVVSDTAASEATEVLDGTIEFKMAAESEGTAVESERTAVESEGTAVESEGIVVESVEGIVVVVDDDAVPGPV